jgi:uncharacterized protein (TIGR03083 family)
VEALSFMSEDIQFSKAELLRRIQAGWDTFQGYIGSLTEEQLTVPTDAAGWTAKDHIAHLSVWEDSAYALLTGAPRWQIMGIDEETWNAHDMEKMNGDIKRLHEDKTLDEARALLQTSHRRLLDTIESMTDEELQLPFSHYASNSSKSDPVWFWIVGNSYGHYEEHTPWIEAIVNE